MNTDSHIRATAILLLAGALPLFCYLLTVAVRQYRSIKRDAILFRLFAARDKLYLAASDGLIDARSDAFRQMRDSINFLICRSDEAGAIQFFVTVATRKQEPLDSLVERLPQKARAPYVDILLEVGKTVHDLFVFNSRILRVWYALNRIAKVGDGVPRRTTVVQLEQRIGEAERLRGRFCAA